MVWCVQWEAEGVTLQFTHCRMLHLRSHTCVRVCWCICVQWEAEGDGVDQGLFYREPESQLTTFSHVSEP